MTIAEELLAGLRPMAQTVRDKLDEVEYQISERTAELSELREARFRLTALVKQLDPSLLPEKKKAKTNSSHGIGDTSYLPFTEWLRENRSQINESKGIWANGLLGDSSFTVLTSSSVIAKALARAHEEGLIRLDAMGQGGRKIYKVV